jgi:hypothetical protein
MFTGLHHADKKPVENAGMLGDRFVKGFAALHAGGDVADNVAQALLALWIALVVEGGQRLDQRNASLNHGGELAGKENEVGFLDAPRFLARFGGDGFLLEGEDHQPPAH